MGYKEIVKLLLAKLKITFIEINQTHLCFFGIHLIFINLKPTAINIQCSNDLKHFEI